MRWGRSVPLLDRLDLDLRHSHDRVTAAVSMERVVVSGGQLPLLLLLFGSGDELLRARVPLRFLCLLLRDE